MRCLVMKRRGRHVINVLARFDQSGVEASMFDRNHAGASKTTTSPSGQNIVTIPQTT
jgi:hypothetical protein